MALVTAPGTTSEIFKDVYMDKLDHALQQKESRLSPHITQSGAFVGDKAYFPQMDAVIAENFERMAEISLKNGAHKLLEVQCTARIAVMGVFDIDKNKLGISQAAEYADATDKAIKRDLDKIIYDAMLTAANAAGSEIITLGTYNDDLSFATILQAIATLEDQEATQDDDIAMLVPALPKAKLTGDLNLALVTANQSGVGNGALKFLNPLDGLSVVLYGKTSSVTAAPAGHAALGAGVIGTDVFVWAKSAVVGAYNDAPTKVDERQPNYFADAIGVWHQTGAMVRFPKGMIRIRCRRNPVVSITPLKIAA